MAALKSRLPKYYQIVQSLTNMIRDENLGPGDRILSLTEIMDRFQVSKVTAVRALAELENEGVIRREHGRGTFVAEPRRGDAAQTAVRPTVHVVVPEMTNPYYAALVEGIARELGPAGIAIEISTTGYRPERQTDIVQKIIEDRRLFGMVIASVGAPADRQSAVSAIPIVYVDYCPPELLGTCSLVCCDNFRGASEAVRYLTGLGHQRIGYIDILQTSSERLAGFRHELRAHGLNDSHILSIKQGHSFDHDLMRFVKQHQLTALFSVNDVTAMKTMRILRRHGLNIPHDISIMGYDNIEAAAYLDVPLTTMEQPSREIGRRTADLLLEAKRPGGTAAARNREIVYMPHLVVRESTAAPRNPQAAEAHQPLEPVSAIPSTK
ncbi:MAG: GntR family transcriptional regulator [bacterium]